MPIYTYVDKHTGKAINVIRTFTTYEEPPTKEEATKLTYEGKVVLTEEEFENAEFERKIGSGITVTFAQYSLKGKM